MTIQESREPSHHHRTRMNYRLITALPSDHPWLEDLRRQVYQELFQVTWGGWDEARHLRHFSDCIQRGHISIIEVDGIRAGMVQLFDQPGRVEVGEIQVWTGDQGRGIGSRVLMDIIAEAHRQKKGVHLHVGLKNDKAFRLYQRLGFQWVSRSETHNHMECMVPTG